MSRYSYAEQAKRIIKENIYCTIATATKEGYPWVSPVFYAYDDMYTLYWVSSKKAKHSILITQNSHVAIVIFNSQAPEGDAVGVYFEANASEISDDRQFSHAIETLNKRITKKVFTIATPESVKGEAILRIYYATIQRASILTEGEFINGQYVDARTEFSLF